MTGPGDEPRPLREKEAWLLAALTASLFWPLLRGKTLFFRDLYLLFYPQRVFLHESLAQLRFPSWNPLLHGGQSHLTPTSTLFHPTTLLSPALPPLLAFNLAVALQVVAAALGAYWLARTLGLPRPAAFVAGGTFALSGIALSGWNLTPLVLSLPWLPLALGNFHRALLERSRRRLAFAGLFTGLPLLGATAEVTAMLLGLLLLWCLVLPGGREERGHRLRLWGVTAGLAVALAAVQLVPAAVVIRHSARSVARGWESFTQWSIHPARLAELVVPGLLGPTDVADEADFRGREAEDRGFPYFLSIYLGAVALPLAVAGGVARRRRGPLPARLRYLLLSLVAAGVLLALGRFLPGFRSLYEAVPAVATIRYPVKALYLVVLPAALLAACGFEAAMGSESGSRPSRVAPLLLGAVAASTAFLAALPAVWPSAWDAVARALFAIPLRGADAADLRAHLLHAAGFAGLAAAACLAGAAPSRWGAPALALLTVGDLAFAGRNVNAWADGSLYDEPPLATSARRVAGGRRLFRDPRPAGEPAGHSAATVRRNLEGLRYFTAPTWGIPVSFHEDYDDLSDSRMRRLTTFVLAQPWERRVGVLAAAGVGAVVTPDAGPIPGLTELPPVSPSGGMHLYELPESRVVRFAARARVLPDQGAALRALAARPPGEASVLLSEPLPDGSPAPGGEGCAEATVDVLDRRPGRWRVETRAPCPGLLVFAETFTPGWDLRVDGRPVPMVRADFAFSAVPVPAGRHVVDKRYAPGSLLIGAILSAAALLAVVLLASSSTRTALPPSA